MFNLKRFFCRIPRSSRGMTLGHIVIPRLDRGILFYYGEKSYINQKFNKNTILPICFLLFISLLFSSFAIAEDLPVWWKQIANEAEREGYSLVTPDELKKIYASEESFLIVDVREDYEYKKGHLPKAVNFEIDLGDRAQLKPKKRSAFLKLLGPDKNRKIIIYCRSFRCLKSGIAASCAVRLGYKNISRFPNGFFEWRDLKLPIER